MKKQLRAGATALLCMAVCTSFASNAFVTNLNRDSVPHGLQDRNIAMWQSHGWYFEPKLNRWEWQRARIFQTVEDLYTQSYVMPFLMPMLQNAGAYVMSPRERDIQTVEFIIDNDNSHSGYSEHKGSKRWNNAPNAGFGHDGSLLTDNVNPFRNGTARMVQTVKADGRPSYAQWTTDIPKDGTYAVYVSYQSLPNSATDAIYTINAANGPQLYKVNQKMGGGTWIYLGHFPFNAGESEQPLVQLSNISNDDDAVITADAVKIGGGIGNVARRVIGRDDGIDYQYVSSGYPRFTEGARYFLQWAGAPDSVYTESQNVNDYTDDYKSRGLWVNWLTGGSPMLPDREGLNIPVDLSFAFHSDAGTTRDSTIIGTLGIYCTDDQEFYPGGTPRMASHAYTDSVMTNICEDIRATFEPNWTRRDMWNKSYYEARVPQVPAMLLELLSHQNFADMKYGLDPGFRFLVSRAIYKGMLKFLAAQDGIEYVVQPLPVSTFAITGGESGIYHLSWTPTVDKLEATAVPTGYIIEERTGDEIAFHTLAETTATEYTVTVNDNNIHSYRVTALNDGGYSFPSEVLALCYVPDAPQVVIVNGFTRVSGPDTFDSGEIAGFYDVRDPGVPYIQDISYIGCQFEFRRDIPWMDDDAAGFGASRSNYERDVIAGNTFDYPAVHGDAIKAAGCGFISMSVAAFCEADIASLPKNLDLILGKQKEIKTGTGHYGTRFKTFPAPLQDKIREYTAGGGNVLVTGSFIATDLWDNPYSSAEVAERDQAFATEVLGYHWRVGQASVTGEAYEVTTRFPQFDGGHFDFYNTLNPDFYAVQSPDSFYAADRERGCTMMRYSENNLVAGTAFNAGGYRTVAIGFPFETIRTAQQRNHLMNQIIKFFTEQ